MLQAAMSTHKVPWVPAEVRGKMRMLKTKLNKDYDTAIDNLSAKNVSKMVINATIKTSKIGRQRAFNKAQKLLPGVKLEWQTKHYSVWSTLRHREAVIGVTDDPGEKQDAVTLDFIVAGTKMLERDSLVVYRGLWSLEIPDHAVLRMFWRSRNIDVPTALYEAHNWLLGARRISPMPRPEEVFFLPAGDGVLLGNFISGIGESGCELVFYFRAKTWLHNDQLYDSQTVMSQEIEVGKCFGTQEFLPAPLRIVKETDLEMVFDVVPLYKPFLRGSREEF